MTRINARPSDIISVRGLKAEGRHGVLPHEQEVYQPFIVDLSLWVDTHRAASSDNIEDTVSYAELAAGVERIIEGQSVSLLETLAERIAEMALKDPRVNGVEVVVHKPSAPLPQIFDDVFVMIRRGVRFEEEGASASDAEVILPGGSTTAVVQTTSAVPFSEVSEDAPARSAESTGSPSAATGLSPSLPPLPPVPVVPATGPLSDFPAPIDAVPRLRHKPQSRSRTSGESAASQGERPVRNAVLALGGNLGDVPVTLRSAIDMLLVAEGIELVEVSALVRTHAVIMEGQAAQPDYWNAVVLAKTSLPPEELLAVTQGIETALGRERHEYWGARTIDIDLIQIEGITRDDANLTLPHPRAHERAFVLVPWLLIQDDAELAGYGKIIDLAEKAPDASGIVTIVHDWLEAPDSVLKGDAPDVAAPAAAPAPPSLSPADAPTQRFSTAGFNPPRLHSVTEDTSPSSLPVEPPSFPEPVANETADDAETFDTNKQQVKWRPLRTGGRAEPSHRDRTSAPSAVQGRSLPTPPTGGAEGWAGPVRGSIPRQDPLPSWSFSRDNDARIIEEDPSADGGNAVPTGPSNPSNPDQYRSVLDPGLPPGTPRGPRSDRDLTDTSIQRRATIRPTVTGPIPIVKDEPGETP